jgi:preprotein translocase subunit SecY
MLKFLTNLFLSKKEKQNNPTKKIFLTLFLLFLFRFGNTIPLVGIDQEALKKSFFQLENKNSLLQLINMYSGGGGIALLSPFSLGIIPYINASILIDLFTALFPFLEKLQSEEGELGRKKLNFYKKIATLIFAIFQSVFLIFYLKTYFYDRTFFSYFLTGLELITGSFLIVWLTSILDNQGIGNGTSLIIFTNIIVTLISKNFILSQNLNEKLGLELLILLLLIGLICVSQTARINIDVVSARQLAYLENVKKENLRETIKANSQIKENGLSIRFNQAGIFPIIIASNLLPFFSFLNGIFDKQYIIISTLLYYVLIIGFNYFYTLVFWDPEKISEQLRKASVSVINITPGKETVKYLETVVRSTSLLGGLFLCFILILYESLKYFIGGVLLPQINISSLIILVGVAYEIQKNMRALYKNILEENINQLN